MGGFDEGVYQGYSTNTGYGYGHYEDRGRAGWSGRRGGEGTWSRDAGYTSAGSRWPRSYNEGQGWFGEVGYGYGSRNEGGQYGNFAQGSFENEASPPQGTTNDQRHGPRGWSSQGYGQAYGSQGWTGGHYGEGMPGHRGSASYRGDSNRAADTDMDPHFHRYLHENLSGYDRHYQSWRGEQEKKLRDEYEKYRKEQQSKWSKEFESWRGGVSASGDDDSRKSMGGGQAKKS